MKNLVTALGVTCLIIALAACSTNAGTPQPDGGNCASLINDPYFSYVPVTDKEQDPRGYFEEVVKVQDDFVQKIQDLIPVDIKESELIGAIGAANSDLLTIYRGQMLIRTAGQTAVEFQRSLSDEEFNDWVEAGIKAKATTTMASDAMQAYADYCNGK